ncbi:MAG TPA: hypothetical protein PKV86_09060, partial [Syntrophobacteraceae bacterium]|nr:hypothetical protein [Syntrophobacteraceae bacterium]
FYVYTAPAESLNAQRAGPNDAPFHHSTAKYIAASFQPIGSREEGVAAHQYNRAFISARLY